MESHNLSEDYGFELEFYRVKDKIWLLVIPDQYHRSMTFLRAQEHYESPCEKFRGQFFHLWEYIDWYSKPRNGIFSYPMDWLGFNVPLPVVDTWFSMMRSAFPQDKHFMRKHFLSQQERALYDAYLHINLGFPDDIRNGYLIGTSDLEDEILPHELLHACFATIPEYKQTVLEFMTREESQPLREMMKHWLAHKGYTTEDPILSDESQAYLLEPCWSTQMLEFFPEGSDLILNERRAELLKALKGRGIDILSYLPEKWHQNYSDDSSDVIALR